jgi:hypothetical protein
MRHLRPGQRCIRLPFTLILAATLAGPVAAQTASAGAGPPPVRPRFARAVWAAPARDRSATAARTPLGGVLGPGDRDYRYPGFFVGAGLGVAAMLVSIGMCSDSDSGGCNAARVVLLGPVAVGAVGLAGAVVGGLFPKAPGPNAPSK